MATAAIRAFSSIGVPACQLGFVFVTYPLPPSPDDDHARRAAARHIGRTLLVWGIPLILISALCLALGLPWWIVAIGVVGVVAYILFEA